MALRISRLNISLTGTSRSARRAFKKLQDAGAPLTRSLRKVANVAKLVSGAFAALVGVGAGFSIVKAFGDIDSLAKFSTRLGIAVHQLQALEIAGAKAGLSQQQLRNSLQRSARKIAEAATGSGEAVKALNELKLDPSKLTKANAFQQLQILNKAFDGVRNQSDKLRLAFKLFESEGVAILQLFAGQGLEIKKAAVLLEKYNGAISNIDAAKVEAANDAFTGLGIALKALRDRIAISIAPIVERIALNLADIVPVFTRSFEAIRMSLEKTKGPLRVFRDLVNGILNFGSGESSLETTLKRVIGSVGDLIENTLITIKQFVIEIRKALVTVAAELGELLANAGNSSMIAAIFGKDVADGIRNTGSALQDFAITAARSIKDAQAALNEQIKAPSFSETFNEQFNAVKEAAAKARKQAEDAGSESAGVDVDVFHPFNVATEFVKSLNLTDVAIGFARSLNLASKGVIEGLKNTAELFVAGAGSSADAGSSAGAAAVRRGSIEAARAASENRTRKVELDNLAIQKRQQQLLEQIKTGILAIGKIGGPLQSDEQPIESFSFGSTS